MRRAIPKTAMISKDAIETINACTSEFISFITSQAAEDAQKEKRLNISGVDIIKAMTTLGLENYGEALRIYFQCYRRKGKPQERIHFL
ncbi:hypothetical protein PV05_09906 [Exophiala xenobiotica]|uniref:Transcription factor CBF/NF-Y/archaeal histone domain-containing protein n=1 Tax=Exophiala xenobiotica TaxID=348802 RepID=A0A0D2E6R7_9EURO|nr:uncharacterized protein PV05_09906 [Exophiala xenobiotica]KIW51158.1 hypothetical protein PV05_09906 [Exophiala xenobiotica]